MKLEQATKEELLELIDYWIGEFLDNKHIKKRLEDRLYFIRSEKILKLINQKIEQSKTQTPLKNLLMNCEITKLFAKLQKMDQKWKNNNKKEDKVTPI